MSRPQGNAKSKALKSFLGSSSDEELVCPPPLSQRLRIGQDNLPVSHSSSSTIGGRGIRSASHSSLSTIGGRGILSASHSSSSTIGGRGILSASHSSSSTIGGRGILSASHSASSTTVGRGLLTSRIAKEKANLVLQECDDSASDEENSSGSESTESNPKEADTENGASDAESDTDSDTDSVNGGDITNNQSFHGRDGTLWMKESSPCGRSQALNVMRSPGGLSAFGRRHCKETALSNWQLFFDDILLDAIVDCTNEKARSEKADCITNRHEMATYIGVGILIGVYKGKGEPIRALWSPAEGRKCISQFMSQSRYVLLTKYLRFDVTSTRQSRRRQTKFAPMGTIYDMWEQRLSRPFIPYAYVTVDETLVPFRGRCNFKQFMPSKPAKYGLKFWCLCDAATAYCIRMRPYLGIDNADGSRAVGLGQQVVLELTEGLDVGRTVITDNFFTSLALAQALRHRSLGLIGTMRKNRRELPEEFTRKNAEVGSSLFGFNKDATLVSYAPKRNRRVVLISSEHTHANINTQTGKPDIILSYNSGKGGVDHLDQMCSAYTTRKRTTRWPKCAFQHMVDVSAFNSYVIWKEATGNTQAKRRQFLKMLGAELCGGSVDAKGNILLTEAKNVPPTVITGTRLRCRQCQTNKTTQRCSKCEKPLCIHCASYFCPGC
jgi:hypothetical protein